MNPKRVIGFSGMEGVFLLWAAAALRGNRMMCGRQVNYMLIGLFFLVIVTHLFVALDCSQKRFGGHIKIE